MAGWQAPERQEHVRARLDRLASAPPQCLLMEGGSAADRLELALYWAARNNCVAPGAPCGDCPACRQIRERVFLDLHLFDGAADSIKVDEVRELRPVWGQPPRGDGRRVTVFHEAQALGVQAANALLKSLEEPRPGNLFVLLAPQRERLLPTLASRSFILTLAWPADPGLDPEAGQWLEAMLAFRRTGRGWFERTQAKGGVDRALAYRVLLASQRALRMALAGDESEQAAAELAALGVRGMRRFDLILQQVQEALEHQVNPALVLDWAAVQAAAS